MADVGEGIHLICVSDYDLAQEEGLNACVPGSDAQTLLGREGFPWHTEPSVGSFCPPLQITQEWLTVHLKQGRAVGRAGSGVSRSSWPRFPGPGCVLASPARSRAVAPSPSGSPLPASILSPWGGGFKRQRVLIPKRRVWGNGCDRGAQSDAHGFSWGSWKRACKHLVFSAVRAGLGCRLCHSPTG